MNYIVVKSIDFSSDYYANPMLSYTSICYSIKSSCSKSRPLLLKRQA